eukprot:scaffold2229_cov413-Prasinococcus_capsulatus_cf.AAC.2
MERGRAWFPLPPPSGTGLSAWTDVSAAPISVALRGPTATPGIGPAREDAALVKSTIVPREAKRRAAARVVGLPRGRIPRLRRKGVAGGR